MEKVEDDNYVTASNQNYNLKEVDWLKNKCANFEMLIDQKDEKLLILKSILMEILELNDAKIENQSLNRIQFEQYEELFQLKILFYKY